MGNSESLDDCSPDDLDEWFAALEDMSPDDHEEGDSAPELSDVIGGYSAREESPDDVEDGLGTLTPPELINKVRTRHHIVDYFRYSSGGSRRKSKGPFLFTHEDSYGSYAGVISRQGKILAHVRLNYTDGNHYELGGVSFIDKFMKILNGQDKDPQLRRFRASDFNFLYQHEWIHFKAGRLEHMSEKLCNVFGIEIVYYDKTGRLKSVLQKALIRTLIREGIDQNGGDNLPNPTRYRRNREKKPSIGPTLH